MKEFKTYRLLSLALALFFGLPYLNFLRFFGFTPSVSPGELGWALQNTLLQSSLAALVVTVLALPLSQGLLALPEKYARVVRWLLLVPQVFPAFFSVLIAFSLLNPFPMGTAGLIFIYVLVNLGFATLLVAAVTREKLGSMAAVSEIYGLGRIMFLRKVYFQVLKADLLQVFLLIFIFCFSSFSIPLMAGGGRGTNIEVLIFEKLFISQDWGAALSLSFLQTGFIFMISFFLLNPRPQVSTESFTGGRYLSSYSGLVLLLLYLGVYLGAYGKGVLASLDPAFFRDYLPELVESTAVSVRFLLVYLLFNAGLLYLWLLDYLNTGKFNVAGHLISPSTAVVGFSFYLWFSASQQSDLAKIVFGMSLLVFPALFRIFLQKPVEGLAPQILNARIYNIPKPQIIIDVIIRQLAPQFRLWLAFLVIWFLSDYAILRSMGVQTQTLGLLSQNFLGSYRLPLAYLMSLYILIVSFLLIPLLYLLTKALYVGYKKFTS